MTLALPLAHRLAPLARVPTGHLLIHEVYASVQGESTFAGLPCVFVRCTGCSLRCKWCDTPHAFTQGEPLPADEVLRRAVAFDIPLVELTGGEPLEQPGVRPLMIALADAGKTVLLETSGALDISGVDRRVHVIMDLKCPDSGEEARNLWANLDHLKPTDEIKFVLASRRDWEWTVDVIRRHRLDERFACLVSAVFGTLRLDELAGWLVAAKLGNVRMQLQMHKYIWEPTARGV